MARFSDNPQKSPLTGSELLAATDTDTGNDIAITPDALTQYAQENMSLAGGSENGLMTGAQSNKLNALRTDAATDLLLAQLGQIPFPIFIGTPVDGTIELYRNVLGNNIVFDFMYFELSSGSTNVSVLIDGTPITGWSSVPVTTASGSAAATAAKTLAPGSVLSLTFAGSSTPQNLRLSLKGNLSLV